MSGLSVYGLPVSLERRRFIVALAGGAAGIATARLVPAASAAAVAPGIEARGERLDAATGDGVWGPAPGYAAPIGFGRPRHGSVPPPPPVDDPQLGL